MFHFSGLRPFAAHPPSPKYIHEENEFWLLFLSDKCQGTVIGMQYSVHQPDRCQKLSSGLFHNFLAKADGQFHNTLPISDCCWMLVDFDQFSS